MRTFPKEGTDGTEETRQLELSDLRAATCFPLEYANQQEGEEFYMLIAPSEGVSCVIDAEIAICLNKARLKSGNTLGIRRRFPAPNTEGFNKYKTYNLIQMQQEVESTFRNPKGRFSDIARLIQET